MKPTTKTEADWLGWRCDLRHYAKTFTPYAKLMMRRAKRREGKRVSVD